MSDWLELMLDEIRRKQREAKEAREEAQRRTAESPEDDVDEEPQSK